jgi:pimeloyl-ACP methyl ester carboxylesterase
MSLMPHVERPDGVTIRWDERGHGPVVLLIHHVWTHPHSYEELLSDLARDHRVVTYDPRGSGQSTRRGPYDPRTDAGDLEAVAEACGGAAVAIAVGAGVNRAVRVATARPQLMGAVLAIGPAAAVFLPRAELKGSDGLFASESVIGMLVQLMQTEPRAALRTLLEVTNPQLDERGVRERLDLVSSYSPPETMSQRLQAWMEDDVQEDTRRLGDRLHLLHSRESLLLDDSLAGRVRELFPGAHL